MVLKFFSQKESMQYETNFPSGYLINEAESLLTRLEQVKPFTMTMPMVKGASVSARALKEITELLEKGKKDVYHSVHGFIAKAKNYAGQTEEINKLQTAYTILKLRYNSILDQLDIFADVLTQRAEHEVGIWLSGLDVLAEDGLTICKAYADVPALMVFLQRGHGAAIRRARTRLPGGDENPVAVIQIPRERMVGSGIAASLIHEVGHQAAESMDFTKLLRQELGKKVAATGKNKDAWKHYERWISEILADCWAMGHLGIAATQGLMGVVTLPKYFQFRLDMDDPHPAPYVRVKLSCAFGRAMYPHPQWDNMWQMWEQFYPADDLPADKIKLLNELKEEEEDFVKLVLQFRPPALKGKMIAEIFPMANRQPAQLQRLFQQWKADQQLIQQVPPTLLFAVTGQAKFDFAIKAPEENRMLTQQLRNWAYNRN
jgi:hypothetical protein